MPRGKNDLDWATEEDVILMRLWKAGVPTKVIAEALPGRTPSAVAKRRQRLSLPRRSGKGADPANVPEMQRIWRALRKHPATRAALAARAKVSHSTVSKFVKTFRSQLHVCGWAASGASGDLAQVLKAGPGADVPRPAPIPPAERCRRWWDRCKRERPIDAGRRVARDGVRRREREGKHLRRDIAAIALFGENGGA